MTPAYLAHFGLREQPFSKELPDAALWLPPSKQSLVDDLLEALQERQSVLLVGEPGVGKTCVLRAIRHRLANTGFRLTYNHNSTLGRRDFYRQLCLALGIPATASAASVFFAVSRHVEELAAEKAHPVFLLDEAHLLHQDMLDHLHILLNYEWDSKALLSVVLIGLPELAHRLAMRRNRSIYSRIQARLSLGPPSPEDTAEYLRMRLTRADCQRELFPSDSVAMLHEAAAGSLRDLDRMATSALRDAARKKRKLVERDTVGRILALEAPRGDPASENES
jgi:type II secretory pathway predicted ATPase ExeA